MKLIKALLFIIVVLVVLAVAGVLGVALFADRAVQKAVEAGGSKALTVPVAVDKADVSLLAGSVGLKGIAVANPAGYQGKTLLTLAQTDVKADARSLLSDEVLIHDLTLSNMEVFVEQRGLQNNLHDIVKVLRERPAPTGKRLIIERLLITGITAHLDVPLIPGQSRVVTVQVDPIEMTDLGRDERLDTTVLISKIILAVAAGVARQSGDVLPEGTVKEMTSILDSVIDIGRTIFGGKRSGTQQKDSTDLGDKVTEGLKDLLDGKKL